MICTVVSSDRVSAQLSVRRLSIAADTWPECPLSVSSALLRLLHRMDKSVSAGVRVESNQRDLYCKGWEVGPVTRCTASYCWRPTCSCTMGRTRPDGLRVGWIIRSIHWLLILFFVFSIQLISLKHLVTLKLWPIAWKTFYFFTCFKQISVKNEKICQWRFFLLVIIN